MTKEQHLIRLVSNGASLEAAADQLGITISTATEYWRREKKRRGQGRVDPFADLSDFAEALANGATLTEASRAVGRDRSFGQRALKRMRAQLGAQAR